MKFLPLLLVVFLFGCATTPEKKYANTSTPEVKLRHAQLVQSLAGDASQPDIEWIKPIWARGASRSDRVKEKEEIERELLRRFQAGDKGASLLIFQ
jgi:hypothetical protein